MGWLPEGLCWRRATPQTCHLPLLNGVAWHHAACRAGTYARLSIVAQAEHVHAGRKELLRNADRQSSMALRRLLCSPTLLLAPWLAPAPTPCSTLLSLLGSGWSPGQPEDAMLAQESTDEPDLQVCAPVI